MYTNGTQHLWNFLAQASAHSNTESKPMKTNSKLTTQVLRGTLVALAIGSIFSILMYIDQQPSREQAQDIDKFLEEFEKSNPSPN